MQFSEMRIFFRRRFSLRFFFILGISIILILFLTTVIQFDSIESNQNYETLKRNHRFRAAANQAVKNSNNELIIKQRRIDRLKAKVENKFKLKFDNYDNVALEDSGLNYDFESKALKDYSKAVIKMQRIVHLDLKGSPPKLKYLKELIPYLKQAGATGVLIEYEDFFPYSGDLESVKNQNHYTTQELKQIFNLLNENQLSLIPLIQTYGHLEFILKLKEFSHLREDKKHYQVISPCLNESYEKVLYKMIDQILDSHPENIDYIHIGCDEVYHVNVNPACASLSSLKTVQDFFIYHVSKLIDYIKLKRPGLKVMIWEDMIRKNMLTNLNRELKSFSKKIIPMVWNYRKKVQIDENTWLAYNELFSEIWVASAFKGATKRQEIIPNIQLHYENHESWLKTIRDNFNNPSKIKGIALTGWSRYDHMQTVCEIIPAAIPSLVLSLQQIINFNETDIVIYSKAKEFTKCTYSKSPTGFILDVENEKGLSNSVRNLTNTLYDCQFPGNGLYKWLLMLKIVVSDLLWRNEKYADILNPYSVKYNFFNTMIFEEAKAFYPFVHEQLIQLKNTGEKEFDNYFYADLYEEILNVYIIQNLNLIEGNILKLNKTTLPEHAPVRPFNKIVQSLM